MTIFAFTTIFAACGSDSAINENGEFQVQSNSEGGEILPCQDDSLLDGDVCLMDSGLYGVVGDTDCINLTLEEAESCFSE